MHRLSIVAVVLALTLSQNDVADSHDGAAVMTRVITFRLYWLDDSLPFEACSVYRALGEPANFPVGLVDPPVSSMLKPEGRNPCSVPEPDIDPTMAVRVDSMDVAPPVGHVYLTVRRGEYRMQETYEVRRYAPDFWEVADVRIGSLSRNF